MPWRRTMSRARNSAARRPTDGPSRGEPAVDHRPGQQVQRDHDQADPDGEQGDGGEAVDGRGEGRPTATPTRRSAEPSSTWGQQGSGWWWTCPATSTPMKPPRVASRPPTARMTSAATQGRPLGLGPEELALHDQQNEDGGAHEQRDHVRRVDDVEDERCGQQRHGHQPGAALPLQDAPRQHDHPDAGDGHEGAGRLHDGDGQVLRDQVQMGAQRRGHRGEQVDQRRPRRATRRRCAGCGAPGCGRPPPRAPAARTRRWATRPPARRGPRPPWCGP